MTEVRGLKELQLMIVQHAEAPLRTSYNEEAERGVPFDFPTSLKLLASMVKESGGFKGMDRGVTRTLLEKYRMMMREARIKLITDKGEYMLAWENHVSDYLYDVSAVIDTLKCLLAMERQHRPEAAEADPKLARADIFAQALTPLLDLTKFADKAFLRSPLGETWEGRIVSSQVAKMNNAMVAPQYIFDTIRAGPATQSQIELAIEALKSLFDPNDHLRTVYLDLMSSQGLKLEINHSGVLLELENKIAVRRMIDAILYNVGLNQQGEPANLVFKLDEQNRQIDVSYGSPQPTNLADVLKDIAKTHRFTGSLNFVQDETGITGLSIMDQPKAGSSGGTLGSDDVRGSSMPTPPSGSLSMPYSNMVNPAMALTLGAQAMFCAARPV